MDFCLSGHAGRLSGPTTAGGFSKAAVRGWLRCGRQALDEVNEAGKSGGFLVTGHAKREATECSASRYDIQEALRTAHRAHHQPKNGRWRIVGKDLDGDDLTAVVELDAGVVVVTVF